MTITINLPEEEVINLRRAAGNRERAVIELLAQHADGGIPGITPEPAPEEPPEVVIDPVPEPRSTENESAPAEEEAEDDSAG